MPVNLKKKWRLQSLAGNIFVDAETFPLEVNKAYFLITRNDFNILPKNVAKTNRLSYYDYVGMPIKSGWNLIGNPFPFRVSISKLRIENPSTQELLSISDAYEYLGERGWLKADYLNPWEGLAIYSPYDTKLHFLVGYDYIPKEMTKNIFNDCEFISQIIVSNDKTVDEENYFGIKKDAIDEKDNFDKPEPPIITEGVAGYFFHPEWNLPVDKFSEDIKSYNVEGNEWYFYIHSGSCENIKITIRNLINRISNLNVYLFDIEANCIYNISNNNIINLPGFIGEKKFRILIGSENYIKEKTNKELIPKEIKISNNYPNPFNSNTLYIISLPVKSFVKIILYDINGRIVKEIENKSFESGYHPILIDANNLSTGVYYCRFYISGFTNYTEVKKLMIIK